MGSVSVLGLGAMGAAMARGFLRSGHSVTVWNRSSFRIAKLVEEGAIAALTPAEAIAASPLSVMCVIDCPTAGEIIAAPSVAKALAGKALVQFSTGTMEQVSAQQRWVVENGGSFIAASIMGFPTSVGHDDTLLMYAGDPVFHEHRHVLAALGRSIEFLGEDSVTVTLLNHAIAAHHMGSMSLFFEGAAAARAYGIEAGTYWSLLQRTLPGLESGLEGLAGKILQRDYSSDDPDEAGASIGQIRSSMLDALKTFQALGLEPLMTEATLQCATRGSDLGHSDKDFSYLTECFV